MSASVTVPPPFDPWLLSILICPVTRTALRYDPCAQELISAAAGLAYPIRQGVPVMLVEQARQLAASDRPGHDMSEQVPDDPDSGIEGQPEA